MRSRFVFQMVIRTSIAPSRISSDGRCGRKSFPTKKMRKTQSSIARSRSNGNECTGDESSTARYSRRIATSRKMNGLSAVGFWTASASPGISLGLPLHCDEWCPICPHVWHPRPFLSCAKTSSRKTRKCGSCVASESMIRSASRP